MYLGLNFLANVIIQQYFLNSRCLLIFTDQFNTFDYTGSIPIVQIKIEEENIRQDLMFHYFGCQGIIIKNNVPIWTFQRFEKLIRLNLERFNSRRYLILPGDDPKEILTDIFALDELTYVSDLVTVEENDVYSLWTHRYVGGGNFNEKLLLDYWFSNNKTFKYNNNLYPNKLLNQMGRILRMATFQYEPYSIIGSSKETCKGSEMSTAIAFSEQYNMTSVCVVNPEDYWGVVFENWSGNGLLGNLAMDKADIGFSALYTWEVDYHFLDLSKPLVRTGITCLVPAPKLAAGWLTPLYSYSPHMWIAVGVLFTSCIISLFFLHFFYSKMLTDNSSDKLSNPDPAHLFGYSIFSIIKVFLIQVVTKKEVPSGFNGSYFMGLLYLLSLFLTSTYSSGLSSIMTIPRYENPIDTVEQFTENGLKWGATQDAWITSIQNVEEPRYKAIVSRFTPTSEENLREYSKTGKFAFSIERLPHENFAIGSYIKDDVIGNFHLMQQDFYWEQCLIMARKSSILLPMLDEFILKVFESGLIGYWQNEAVSLYMDINVQKAVKYYYHGHQDQTVVKLRWSHVQGAFGALCLGCIFSIIVFFLELFMYQLKNNKFTALHRRYNVK